MKFLQGIVLACVLLLAACSGLKADPEREAQSDRALQQVIAGDIAGLRAHGSPQLVTPQLPAQVAQMRSVLPRVEPPEGRTVSWTHQAGTNGQQYTLAREYVFPEHVIVTQTLMVKAADGRWQVAGFHFNGGTRAEVEAAGFTLAGKSAVHYLVLAGLVTIPLFIVVTTGTALFRRRWGWAFLSLFSITALSLNWTTGAWSFMPISFNLLGAGFMKTGGVFAPWIFTVGFPLPAILFWALGKNRPKPRVPKTRPAVTFDGPGPETPGS
ncbi:MAG: hypothetical protein Q8K90_00640 [Brevundimonas sp.]|nr:hypothetical protein [Brevundimonas sp.]